MIASALAARWRERTDLRETLLLALAVVIGLQLLRVFLNGLVFYIRDSLGAGSFVPGGYALLLFLVPFLAPHIHRALGPARILALTAGGLALARLAEQFVPWPVVDLGLATIGTALFLLFIPTYVSHIRGRGVEGGSPFALGLLLGIGIDTSIKGVFSTLDLSWQPGVASTLVVIGLVVALWTLLWDWLRASVPEDHGGGALLRLAPLLALGPILFLEALLYQNIGQQTALINWSQALVYLWLVMANALGMLAAIGVMARPAFGGWATLVALGGLFVLLALGERSGVAAAVVVLYGQVALSMSIGIMAVALGARETRAGMGTAAVAGGLGMMLLLVLDFVYYVNYQFDLPGGTTLVPPIAAAIIVLCVSTAVPTFLRFRASAPSWVPAVAATLLLAMPLGYLAVWNVPEPDSPQGFPVRVMSYNLHQGFDVDGYLAIEELARDIEGQSPDIVALQEVSRGWVIDGSFDMLVWLSRRLEMPYVWGPAADSVWGNAILSRYPILDARTQSMPNNSRLALKRSFTTAKVDLGGGQVLLVIATHLHNVPEDGHLREPQVQALLQAWNGVDGSVIMGDLNALPESPEIVMLRGAGLRDAYLASGERGPDGTGDPGYTAPSKNPIKRIDYIWTSRDLKSSGFSLFGGKASDHLGLAVTLDR